VPYLDVEGSTGCCEGGVAELRRACHIQSSGFAKQDTFDLARTIANPKLGALLLVEVVDHDLMLNLVKDAHV
jgi:hypothetical protein